MEKIVQEFISKPNLGFEFSHETQAEAEVFRCRGAFSLGSYDELNALIGAIHSSSKKRIVLDLRLVAHIDSTGIGTLAAIYKGTSNAGREIRVVPSSTVRLALGLAKLDTFVRMLDSLDAALRG
jgi:anti-anti-sigma factor